MTLPDVRGHAEARERLARAHATGNLAQSILLHGPVGIGKERLALWIAQLVLCEHPAAEGPCSECRNCRTVLRLEHPDVHWFFPLPRPEGAAADRLREKLEEHRGAELQLRRENPNRVPSYEKAPAHFLAAIQSLQHLASMRPAAGSRKVFVVGDAELMVPQESSPEAANAFLKLLEEPPADTTLVLTSAQPGALLPTILSRVLPLRLAPVPESDVADFLVQELQREPAEAAALARRAHGAPGRALRLLPEYDGAGGADKLRKKGRDLLVAALSSGAAPRLGAAHSQPPAGGRGTFSEEMEALSEWLRDLLAVASGAEPTGAEPEEVSLLRRAVDRYGIHPLAVGRALDRAAESRELAQGNVNPQLILAELLRSIQAELVRR